MSRHVVSDPVPHNRNRLGMLLGLLLHPFVIFIPALFVVLKDVPPLHALGWVGGIAVLILLPQGIVISWARRQDRYLYQRQTRRWLYPTFGLSIGVCTVVALALGAPSRLLFALVALCVWVPLQGLVNHAYTKVSGHTAVVTGIACALIVMGDLDTPLLVSGAVGVVVATAWARLVTGNHTTLQAVLGILVSAVAVGAAYGLMTL